MVHGLIIAHSTTEGKQMFLISTIRCDRAFLNYFGQIQANLIPWLFIFLSVIVLYFVLSYILKCKWLKFHGAEHKAINAYETGNEISIDTINRESRLHPRCGSTYLIILVPILFILFLISKHIVFSYVISKLFAAGIFLTEGKSKNPIIKGIINCCLFVQRSLTQEPSELELAVALKGVTKIISLEGEANKNI